MSGVRSTNESWFRRLSTRYRVLILLTGLFWVLFWGQFQFGETTDAVVVDNTGDLTCTVEWRNPWANSFESDEIDCDAESVGDLVGVLAHPWPFRGVVSNPSAFGWSVGILLGLETLVVLGMSIRRVLPSDVGITTIVAPPEEGAMTLALVKAPIGRRQTITIGDTSIAVHAPGVLRTPPLLVPKSQIHAISPTSHEGDAVFLRPPVEIFLCPNQYAVPNVGVVLNIPMAIPTKWGWGQIMLTRRVRKANTRFDVIHLAVDRLPSLIEAADERGYPVTSDLTESIVEVIGAETDPSRVQAIQEKTQTYLKWASLRAGGAVLAIGVLLLLLDWFDGQGSASQILIGGMIATGVYAVVAALTMVVARHVLAVEKPARHESGQKTANRAVWSVGGSIALLLVGSWGLEALGVPYHLAVGVGSGVLGGLQTGVLLWSSSHS